MRAMLEREGRLRDVLGEFFAAVIGSYVAGDSGQRGCFIIGTAVTQAVDDADAREMLAGFVADEDQAFRERFARSANALAPGVTHDAAAMIATAALHTLAIRARTGEDRAVLARVADAAVGAICGPG